jgi:hypothetical protein
VGTKESIVSEIEEVHDTGRRSFSDAPEEAGGVDNFRRDFAESSRSRQAGAFGSSPETQRVETVSSEPLSTDDALAILGDAFAARQELAEAQDELGWTREEQLDTLAYSTNYEDRDEIAAAADTLLEAGGGPRMEALLYEWNEQDSAGASQWVESREYAATVATAEASAQQMQQMQGAVASAYAGELADFYASHPEYATGSVKNQLLAVALADDPNIGSSPASFRAGLETARQATESVSNAALSTANEMDFREQFRQEAFRGFRPPADDHIAAAAARRIGPSSPEELTAEVIARAKGTQAQRKAALEARNADFKAQFASHARGSGFGDGQREQVARALEIREEERTGKRAPNRGV